MFDPGNTTLAEVCTRQDADRQRKVLVVLDAGVARVYPSLVNDITRYVATHADALQLTRSPMLVDGGEQVKNDTATLDAIRREIDRGGIDRHSYVIAIGGGAVLDMVGYAAATAHRGIRLIRVPTTILSQNDSGVGVKNGVNAFGKKNFLGTFAPPYAVINDAALIERLPDREWRAGIAEAIKVALLKDPAFFAFIEAHAAALVARDAEAMDWLIYRCAELHLQHIATSGDPFEFGSSRPLDFGHWSAHKLEQISNYAWRHGEAVAIGICLDATYAWRQGLLGEADWRRIVDVFKAVGLPIHASELIDSLQHAGTSRSVLSGLEEFREHLGGELTIMLIRGIGVPYEVHTMDEAVIIDSMQVLKAEHEAWSKKESSHGEHVRAQQSTLAATAD
jgi:3-dehydroquinate synthase